MIRDCIKKLKPYSCARDEFKGEAKVFLDANENSYGSVANGNFNRYPDPLQIKVKKEISKQKNVFVEQIFLGNGSDEAIDLIIRIFCDPEKDKIIINPPTYGMYEVCANINNVEVLKIPLIENFQPDVKKIIKIGDNPKVKVIFLCSPNNPTANLINKGLVFEILNNFKGIVVIDEAYIDFAKTESFVNELKNYPNLIILQTFSKAYGMAALRLGIAFSTKEIISYFNKIKMPYNVNDFSQQKAYEALINIDQKNKNINQILINREDLIRKLAKCQTVKKIYPTDSNFLLIEVENANKAYHYLCSKGVIVRNRHNLTLCDNCLRITVGTKDENEILITELANFN